MAAIDVQVIPLYLQGGNEHTKLPGLYVANPPKKASRSRRNDRLAILLDFTPPAFSDDRLAELLTRLESIYYEKSGSTTSAMRELIEDLNTLILNLNLRHAGNRPRVVGTIGVIVIRNEHFFLAQSGEGHLFAMLPGKVDYLHDEKLSGKGLGVGRSPSVFYAQMPMEAGFKFIYTKQLPDGWDEETFKYAYVNPLHNARRRFLEDSGEDLMGFMLDVAEGRGEIRLQQMPRIIPDQTPAKTPTAAPAPVDPFVEDEDSEELRSVDAQMPPYDEEPEAERPVQAEPAASQPAFQPSEPADWQEPHSTYLADRQDEQDFLSTSPAVSFEEIERPDEEEDTPRRARRRTRESVPMPDLRPGVLKALKGMQAAGQWVLKGVNSVLQRVVPGEELLKIPTPYMAFIAIIVPVLVVTVSALVYAQMGRNEQYDTYYSQALSVYQSAVSDTDVDRQRQGFQTAMDLLDKAETYLVTDELDETRKQVLASWDIVDSVTRLEFEPAIAGNLSSNIQVRRIEATSREVYLLDIASDSMMDPEFRCGAGPYGSIIVKDLIDMALLPENDEGYLLVAMDAGGNLLYCREDQPPIAISLVPPDSNWGNPKAITVENERLYVLDEQLNMVWYYDPSDENYQYRDAPFFFFTEEVPTLKDSIDFAIDREELYLLFLNGETTTCTFSALDEAPTTCVSPAIYKDNRQGREDGATVADAVFYQIQHSQPPEPSLFYLDPINSSIYHFSLRLNLVEQYRPQPELEEELVTAFDVSPTRAIFIALENEIYLAYLP
jgi:hypothetical protein